MYFLKRLFLIVPTFFCIICVNFFIVYYAPGNPVAEIVSQEDPAFLTKNPFKATIMDDQTIAKLKKDFELDKPVYIRFWHMIKRYVQFDFGYSYFKGQPVGQLIKERLPISLQLGILCTLLTFLLAIPLGVIKAIKNQSIFDRLSTFILGGFYAVPPFATAVGLIVMLGEYFPIYSSFRGGVSLGIFVLPIIALVLHNVIKPTILMKNALLEELSKPYVLLVKAKGASNLYILLRHCFKNAFLVTISSFSYVFLFTFFFGTLVIEFLFSLEGLGSLSFEATIHRDYPLILGCLYVYAFFGIFCHIVSDFFYSLLDKRVQLEKSAG